VLCPTLPPESRALCVCGGVTPRPPPHTGTHTASASASGTEAMVYLKASLLTGGYYYVTGRCHWQWDAPVRCRDWFALRRSMRQITHTLAHTRFKLKARLLHDRFCQSVRRQCVTATGSLPVPVSAHMHNLNFKLKSESNLKFDLARSLSSCVCVPRVLILVVLPVPAPHWHTALAALPVAA